MAPRRLLILVLVMVAAFAVAMLARGVKRSRALAQFLTSPESRHRVDVMPHFGFVEAPSNPNPVDIGYATFDIGPRGPLTMSAVGSQGAALVIKTDQVRITILPPFNAGNRPVVPGSNDTAATAALLSGLNTDPISALGAVETTRPVAFPRLIWMSADDFLAHSLRLSAKAASRLGHNQVICFTARNAKGIVQIGCDPTDRRIALVSLSSLSGTVCVGLHVELEGSAAGDIGPLIDRIAGSFRFSINTVRRREEIANMISARGIPMKTSAPTSAPAAR
jgi:hypothetical protein